VHPKCGGSFTEASDGSIWQRQLEAERHIGELPSETAEKETAGAAYRLVRVANLPMRHEQQDLERNDYREKGRGLGIERKPEDTQHQLVAHI